MLSCPSRVLTMSVFPASSFCHCCNALLRSAASAVPALAVWSAAVWFTTLFVQSVPYPPLRPCVVPSAAAALSAAFPCTRFLYSRNASLSAASVTPVSFIPPILSSLSFTCPVYALSYAPGISCSACASLSFAFFSFFIVLMLRTSFLTAAS